MQNSKTYLNVPYAQKDTAKALGAKWDPSKKQWYVPADIDITLFVKWQTQSGLPKSATKTKSKVKPRTSNRNVVLGITTYGKNKDLVPRTRDNPPWD